MYPRIKGKFVCTATKPTMFYGMLWP